MGLSETSYPSVMDEEGAGRWNYLSILINKFNIFQIFYIYHLMKGLFFHIDWNQYI
jgi:hypothetical protein